MKNPKGADHESVVSKQYIKLVDRGFMSDFQHDIVGFASRQFYVLVSLHSKRRYIQEGVLKELTGEVELKIQNAVFKLVSNDILHKERKRLYKGKVTIDPVFSS